MQPEQPQLPSIFSTDKDLRNRLKMTKEELVAKLRDMNRLASWETLTGTRPTIESDRTIATVTFP